MGLALLANFVFGLIGILSHREQELSGTFYRVIAIGERREGISSDLMLIIDGQQVTIKELGQEDRQVIEPE